MSDLTVRDHSQPCQHGLIAPHLIGPHGAHGICPGGREITLQEIVHSDFNHPVYELVDKP